MIRQCYRLRAHASSSPPPTRHGNPKIRPSPRQQGIGHTTALPTLINQPNGCPTAEGGGRRSGGPTFGPCRMQPSILPPREGGQELPLQISQCSKDQGGSQKADASLPQQRATVRHRAAVACLAGTAVSHSDACHPRQHPGPLRAGPAGKQPLITRRLSSSTSTWARAVSGCS